MSYSRVYLDYYLFLLFFLFEVSFLNQFYMLPTWSELFSLDQCLINRDRQDRSDPTMVEFRDKLLTAYQDPALKSIQYSGSIGRLKSPLLHSAVA